MIVRKAASGFRVEEVVVREDGRVFNSTALASPALTHLSS